MCIGAGGNIDEVGLCGGQSFFERGVRALNAKALREGAGFGAVGVDDRQDFGLRNADPRFGLKLSKITGSNSDAF
jgi:hypothetical protein